MGRRFHILDVFTKVRYGGNQLAVVEDADGLSDDEMLAITREFGFSETVFLQSSENKLASARVRIFTPAQEMPFAGHPTIGTAVLLGEMKNSEKHTDADALLLLEEGLGLVRCAVAMVPGKVSYAEFDAPALPKRVETVPAPEDVADALGLDYADIGFENHKISAAHMSVQFVYVPLRNSTIVRRAKPDFTFWDDVFGELADGGAVGVYVYCRDEGGKRPGFHVRMFAPTLGIAEDPATGAAAVGFATVVERFELGSHKVYETRIEQGLEMNRPSLIKLEMDVKDKQVRSIRVGGHAVRVASGELY